MSLSVFGASSWGSGRPLKRGGDELVALLSGENAPDAWQDPRKVARLFVSGDRSQVGKSSTCLALLASLVEDLKYKPSEVAYIKPATQCESVQLVAKYCDERGIDCEPIGPVVYVSGFTREFLAGNTQSSEEMALSVEKAVDKLCSRKGRKIVIVDGVGYPAVGSVVGLSNAVLAKASRAPVILICPKGVGNAIDSFNLNRVFFEHFGVNVIGALFNRFPTEGFYSLEKCKGSIQSYFDQFAQGQELFGCLPEIPMLQKASPAPGEKQQPESEKWSKVDEDRLDALLSNFRKNVNIGDIVKAALAAQHESTGNGALAPRERSSAGASAAPPAKRARTVLTPEEIRARAMKAGAKRGG